MKNNEHILFDLINFNNLGKSLLSVFQVISLENWTDGMMYNFMDADNTYISALFFVLLVMFGSFFLMNLVLAQIIESYSEKSGKVDVIKPVKVDEILKSVHPFF